MNVATLPLPKKHYLLVYHLNFLLNPIVAQEMLEHENTATSSTQTYILKCSRLFQILNSEDPIKVIEDPRIKELEDINNWFKIWLNSLVLF
jgi:hypothetical protein